MKTSIKPPYSYKTVKGLLTAIGTWSTTGRFNSWQYYFAKACLIETWGWEAEKANLYCKKYYSCKIDR